MVVAAVGVVVETVTMVAVIPAIVEVEAEAMGKIRFTFFQFNSVTQSNSHITSINYYIL